MGSGFIVSLIDYFKDVFSFCNGFDRSDNLENILEKMLENIFRESFQ